MPRLTIGMASYNNRAEVWFTVQSLRLYQDLSDVEILIIDNYGDDHLKSFVEGAAFGVARYIRYTEKQGTAAPRDLIFSEATAEWVICIDPHVLLSPGAVARFKEWVGANQGCMDLLQGPLTYDDLTNQADALSDQWGNGMWGVWRGAKVDPDADPYPILMHGLGLFGCRKDAWLGFNPEFRGFGGEEGYIHTKFRQAGREVLCLPFLSWVHLFKVSNGDIPYPCDYADRTRNYTIGFQELGLDLAPLIEHFGADKIKPYLIQESPMGLEILTAEYGGVDVTNLVREKCIGATLILPVRNEHLGGDPCPGVRKELILSYKVDGVVSTHTVGEHGILRVPASTKNKLGIFYTNNGQPALLETVLGRIKLLEDKADIITCPWYSIPNNPFPEVIAMATNSTHLNINVQILQALYLARDCGAYDYVSFLEHDVLYPEGYFDFPEFGTGVMNNENYEGICAVGWQKQSSPGQKPLHEMTMRFDEAIAHFEQMMVHFISRSTTHDVLEPKGPHATWSSQHPSIHINTRKGFTSHCDIYTSETVPGIPYWGDYEKYKLF